MEKPSNIVPIEAGFEKRVAKLQRGIEILFQHIDSLEVTRQMIEGWIDVAREKGDIRSEREYTKELKKVGTRLEFAWLLIEGGWEMIDSLQKKKSLHTIEVAEAKMQAGILGNIEYELEMVDGMIVVLEATEALSREQEEELQQLCDRKQQLESEKQKYV